MAEQKLPQKYVTARVEALRFLEKIEQLQMRFNDDEQFQKYINITGGKETAAVKRSSLDLSRALAELRKPN